jgi:hypothetical protein
MILFLFPSAGLLPGLSEADEREQYRLPTGKEVCAVP